MCFLFRGCNSMHEYASSGPRSWLSLYLFLPRGLANPRASIPFHWDDLELHEADDATSFRFTEERLLRLYLRAKERERERLFEIVAEVLSALYVDATLHSCIVNLYFILFFLFWRFLQILKFNFFSYILYAIISFLSYTFERYLKRDRALAREFAASSLFNQLNLIRIKRSSLCNEFN